MIRDTVYIALFAAIMAALGLLPKIDVGLAVPITAQSMGVMLAGSIIGARRGALSMLLFLALVAAGLPLLAGGRGGLGVFFGPSAGYLVAFPIAAFVIGLLTERFWTGLTFFRAFLINIGSSLAVIHTLGILGMAYVTGMSLPAAIAADAVFLPGDIVKCVIAAAVATFVRRGYPLISPRMSDPLR